MSDLTDLYQDLILDHGRRPRNFGPLAQASHRAEGFNPLCGDRLTLYLRLAGDVVAEAGFEGAGCAIAVASASLMTEALKGKTRTEAAALIAAFRALATGTAIDATAAVAALGKLAVLGGVRAFPARVKCATLPWHTLAAALQADTATASTE